EAHELEARHVAAADAGKPRNHRTPECERGGESPRPAVDLHQRAHQARWPLHVIIPDSGDAAQHDRRLAAALRRHVPVDELAGDRRDGAVVEQPVNQGLFHYFPFAASRAAFFAARFAAASISAQVSFLMVSSTPNLCCSRAGRRKGWGGNSEVPNSCRWPCGSDFETPTKTSTADCFGNRDFCRRVSCPPIFTCRCNCPVLNGASDEPVAATGAPA